jgi:hypothetical protein
MGASTSIRNADEKVLGALMAAASVLTIVFMAHHPTSRTDVALAPPVHGVLMALMLVTFAGFLRFSMQRGVGRTAVLIAVVAYGAGVCGGLLAAAINGFAGPALVARGAPEELFLLPWELNQALAYMGVYATSTAYALWGADLLFRERAAGRLLGVAGIAAGLAPPVLFASGATDMHVAGAIIVYSIEAAFAALIGLRMMTAKDCCVTRRRRQR